MNLPLLPLVGTRTSRICPMDHGNHHHDNGCHKNGNGLITHQPHGRAAVTIIRESCERRAWAFPNILPGSGSFQMGWVASGWVGSIQDDSTTYIHLRDSQNQIKPTSVRETTRNSTRNTGFVSGTPRLGLRREDPRFGSCSTGHIIARTPGTQHQRSKGERGRSAKSHPLHLHGGGMTLLLLADSNGVVVPILLLEGHCLFSQRGRKQHDSKRSIIEIE